jgi:hypothetical protein
VDIHRSTDPRDDAPLTTEEAEMNQTNEFKNRRGSVYAAMLSAVVVISLGAGVAPTKAVTDLKSAQLDVSRTQVIRLQGVILEPVLDLDEEGSSGSAETTSLRDQQVLVVALEPLMEAVRMGRNDAVEELANRLRHHGMPQECVDAAMSTPVADGSVPLSETACPVLPTGGGSVGGAVAAGGGFNPGSQSADLCDGRGGASYGHGGAIFDKPNTARPYTSEETDEQGRRVVRNEWAYEDGSKTWEYNTYDSSGNLAVRETGQATADGRYTTQTTRFNVPGGADDVVFTHGDGRVETRFGPDDEDSTHTETTIREGNMADGSEESWTIDSRTRAGKGTEPRTYLRPEPNIVIEVGEAQVERRPARRGRGNDQPGEDGYGDPETLIDERCQRQAEIRAAWMLNDPSLTDEDCDDPVVSPGTDAGADRPIGTGEELRSLNVCGEESPESPLETGFDPDPAECTRDTVECVNDHIYPHSKGPLLGAFLDIVGGVGCDPSVCDPDG